MIRLDPGEYQACLSDSQLTTSDASDIATAHRNLATWHQRNDNLAMAAWWQSIADNK